MGPNAILDKGLEPNGPIPQWSAVTQIGEEGCRLPSAAGGFVTGFGQDEIDAEDQARGRLLNVRVIGASYAIASEPIDVPTAGPRPVAALANGKVRIATPGDYVIGRCISPVTDADDWTVVFITHEGVLAAPPGP